ncbi:MAG: sensor histidine kinase [Tenuifilaceae bacterium]
MIENKNYFQVKRHILIILSVLVVVGYIIDLLTIMSDTKTFWTNIISIVIVFISVILTYFSILSIRKAFLIIIYSLILNIILSSLFDLGVSVFMDAEFLRSALIIGMLLPIAGFVIEKKHSLYIGSLLLLFYICVIIINHSNYLVQNLYLLLTIIIGYTIGMYYLLYLLEEGSSNQKKLIAELEEKNNELVRTNSLLSELNTYVEIQKEDLKSIVEAREKLLTIISHDIKNPLSAIISFSDLIKSKLNPNENESVLLYINMIQQSANNLFNLIITLLDWTRLKGGKLIVKKGLFDTGERIREAIALFEQSINSKNIEVRIVNIDNIGIVADRHMFSAIIRNLLSNAIKFTPSGGRITLESRIDDNSYCLIISDSGVGMEQENIDLVLNSNKNITSEGTLGESGTGLGLELCKEFIQLHNGELSIISKIGVGSEFKVRFPIKDVN